MRYFFLCLLILVLAIPAKAEEKKGTCQFQCQKQKVQHFEKDSCSDMPSCIQTCDNFCARIGDTCASPTCVRPEEGAGGEAQGKAKYQGRYGLDDPLQGANIPQIISGLIRYTMGFVGALFLAYFLYGGILWMTAGDSERIKTSKKTLKYALAGILVVMLSYTLLSLVIEYVTKINVG